MRSAWCPSSACMRVGKCGNIQSAATSVPTLTAEEGEGGSATKAEQVNG